MKNAIVAIVVGVAAGFGGAWLHQNLAGTGDPVATDAVGSDAGLLREEIEDLRRELQGVKNPPATLTTREAGSAPGAAAGGMEAVVEEVLARLDERVEKTVESKYEELASRQGGERPTRSRRGKKRVSLREAADELGLTRQQEDDLLRIYQESQDKLFKLAAGEDGDVEDVRRDMEEVKGDPTAGRRLLGKYMPNMIKNIGPMMALQAEREEAIGKVLGPEKTKRLKSEFDVKEDNILGFGGGMRFEGRAGSGGR